jgi:hypothetical protein
LQPALRLTLLGMDSVVYTGRHLRAGQSHSWLRVAMTIAWSVGAGEVYLVCMNDTWEPAVRCKYRISYPEYSHVARRSSVERLVQGAGRQISAAHTSSSSADCGAPSTLLPDILDAHLPSCSSANALPSRAPPAHRLQEIGSSRRSSGSWCHINPVSTATTRVHPL